jgi:tetratricopeptide (TPR) repeat protein
MFKRNPMLRNILLLLFLVSSLSLFSQTNLDSLWAEWKNESRHDTVRLNALNTYLFNTHMYINADSALLYIRKYYQFAEQNDLMKFMGIGMSTMGQCYLSLGKIDSALISFERAIEYSTQAGRLKTVAGAHINRGIAFNNLGRSKEALEEYDRGIEICDQIGALDFKLNGLNNKGVIYLNLGEYDNAIPVFKEVIEVARQNSKGSDAHKGGYVNLGFAYARKGDYAMAIDNYNECIKLIDEFGGEQVSIHAYNFLGNSYLNLGETENALKYLWKSLEASETLGEKSMMAQSLMSIGQIHQNEGAL